MSKFDLNYQKLFSDVFKFSLKLPTYTCISATVSFDGGETRYKMIRKYFVFILLTTAKRKTYCSEEQGHVTIP